MRSSARKSVLNKIRQVMNPLRRMALESRPKRNPILTKPKGTAKKHHPVGPKPAWQNHPVPISKSGPQLVHDPKKVQRIMHGDYEAEITVNRKSHPVLFHYLVTKKDSPEILEWGQTVSVHAAISKAKSALKRLMASDSAPERMIAAD
jgi:hypothetical protein